MEFWNDAVTNASWEKLKELNREVKFVLIGGWAVYMYTKLNKSKDIDVIVDYDELEKLSKKYYIHNNSILKKYEIKLSVFDIDVYVPYYSKLVVPPQDILKSLNVSLSGFRVPRVDVLITLKVAAFLSRRDSTKGKKDEVDVIGLMLNENFDVTSLKGTLEKYGHKDYLEVIRGFLRTRDREIMSYLGTDINSLSNKAKMLLEEL